MLHPDEKLFIHHTHIGLLGGKVVDYDYVKNNTPLYSLTSSEDRGSLQESTHAPTICTDVRSHLTQGFNI